MYGLFFYIVIGIWSVVNAQCSGKVELGIAVPGDIPESEFVVFEDKLIELLRYLRIDPDNFNVGLIIYGRKAVEVATPQPYNNRQQINTRVSLLSRRGLYEKEIFGGNDLVVGIKAITKMFKDRSKLRPGTLRIAILFQYGKAVDARKAINAANVAKRSGIVIFLVTANGTGREFNFVSFDYCRRLSEKDFSKGLDTVIPKLGNGICAIGDRTVSVSRINCYPKTYTKVPEIPVECGDLDVMLPDPNNCANYVQCVSGRPYIRNCTEPTLFDPSTGRCNYIEQVECYSNTQMSCPEEFGLFDHPVFCSKFINCYNGTPHAMDCQVGFRFSSQVGTCLPGAHISCPAHKRD